MLPLHYHSYVEFKQVLQQLQQAATSNQVDVSQLRRSFQTAQQFFQAQILSLDGDLESSTEPRVRSYHTEISKQLQMLSMDVMFLQAARQPGTATDRRTQILQRIQTIISYCDHILELNTKS